MRKLSVNQFLTVDGVVQAPRSADEDRDDGFEHVKGVFEEPPKT